MILSVVCVAPAFDILVHCFGEKKELVAYMTRTERTSIFSIFFSTRMLESESERRGRLHSCNAGGEKGARQLEKREKREKRGREGETHVQGKAGCKPYVSSAISRTLSKGDRQADTGVVK